MDSLRHLEHAPLLETTRDAKRSSNGRRSFPPPCRLCSHRPLFSNRARLSSAAQRMCATPPYSLSSLTSAQPAPFTPLPPLNREQQKSHPPLPFFAQTPKIRTKRLTIPQ